jgi:iron complex outermembrane receptor protein
MSAAAALSGRRDYKNCDRGLAMALANLCSFSSIRPNALSSRITRILSILALMVPASVCLAEPSALERQVTFQIPAQSLETALLEFARQARMPVFVAASALDDMRSPAVEGVWPANRALANLLANSGLSYSTVGDTITIGPEGTHPNTAARGLRVAQVKSYKGASDSTESHRSEPEERLEEVLVTAARREQSAQDVAGGLQVFLGSDLDRQGANQFADYLLQTPGVSFRDQGAGAERVSLRGISNVAGSDNGITAPSSTVGLYLDDISISDTSNLPDISSYDLQRIEVLKGPQGTLYGEGAMGGAIKMVPNKPRLDRFEAHSDLTLSGTEGNALNYGLRGVTNIPLLTDKVALRVSGTYQSLDGFIDNLYSGRDKVNRSTGYSVRALLLARLTDRFSAELLALQSAQNQDHFDQADLSLGDLKIYSVEPEFNDVKNDVFGLTLKYDGDLASFTAISSYYTAKRDQVVRVPVLATPVFGSFGTVTQDPIGFDLNLHNFAQELRLVSQGEQQFDWVIGAFYREKKQRGLANLYVAQSDLASVNAGLTGAGLPALPNTGTYLAGDTTDTYRQYAGYGEVNYHPVESLTLTAGLRWFHEDVIFLGDTVGNSILAGATAVDSENFPYSRTVPKFGVSYRFNKDSMVYVQAAQGFRSGIININRSFEVGDIAAKPDKLWNYELGTKTSWADGRLKLNGSLYYVDWKSIQTIETAISPVSNSPIGFFGNGGNARIRGVEIDLAAVPMADVLLGTTFGYTDSEMTEATDDASIVGETLPNVPRLTASGFGEYRFRQTRGDSYFRFDVQHIGRQATRPITTSSDGAWVDGYTLGSLRVGFDAKQRWGAAFFINNLWNERAQLGRGITGAGAIYNLERYTIARPRTFGLTFSVEY